jgi:hypothetical protein
MSHGKRECVSERHLTIPTSGLPTNRPECEGYESLLAKYIRPSLGKKPVVAIRPLEVQAIYQEMTDRGLSPRTVQGAHWVLNAAFRQALQWEMVLEVRTYLIGPVPERYRKTVFSAVELREKLRAERTNLVPKMIETWQEVPLVLQAMDGSDPLYGYIGMDDYTLYPFVRPGAFVRIDPRQKKIPAMHWRSDHDSPIFFVELRERYVCTWCEMRDGRLILIASQQSNRRAQEVRYPADATIIGRVTAISMDIVDAEESQSRA